MSLEQPDLFGPPVVYPITESPTTGRREDVGARGQMGETETLTYRETPHSGDPHAAERTRREGHKKISRHAGSIQRRMLAVYEIHQMTDAEMADVLFVSRTTVIGRRHELLQLGKVEAKGERKNPQTGVMNVTYGLTKC